MAEYSLPDLPYDYSALEPYVSAQIMELHHDKHHAAYVAGANQTLEKLADARDKDDFGAIVGLEKTLAFHISGHVLHSIFWKNQSPDGGDKPDGALASAIDENFGSFDKFKAQFTQATSTIQGSGWGALAYEPLAGRLTVEQVYDHQGNVGQGSIPLLVFDAWEHAFYLQYKNVKADFFSRAVERRQLVRRGRPPRLGQGVEDRRLTAGAWAGLVGGSSPAGGGARTPGGSDPARGRRRARTPHRSRSVRRHPRSGSPVPGRRRRGRLPSGPVRTRSAPPRKGRVAPGGGPIGRRPDPGDLSIPGRWLFRGCPPGAEVVQPVCEHALTQGAGGTRDDAR